MSRSRKPNAPVPHIDELIETAPPWTLPTTPDYALDPWLEHIPSDAVTPRAVS